MSADNRGRRIGDGHWMEESHRERKGMIASECDGIPKSAQHNRA